MAVVVGAAALAGVAGGAVIVAVERDAHRAARVLEAVEAGPSAPLRAVMASRWLARDGARAPVLGGSPRYWDSLARLHLIAASHPNLEPHILVARLTAAEAAARRALEGQPRNHGPWSRVASIDVARDGRLSRVGVHALQQAIESARYRERLAVWRFAFMVPLWDQLTPDLQRAATADAVFLWSRENQWRFRGHVRDTLADAPQARAAIAPSLDDFDTP